MSPNLIIQKEVIDDLYIREDEFKNFVKFLKKNFTNYTLITDFKDAKEFEKSASDNPLLEILLDKFHHIKYIENLKNLLIDENFLNKYSLNSIIICNRDLEECQKIIGERSILFYCLDNLHDWSIFDEIIYNKNYKVTNDKNYPINEKFNSFDNITKYFKYCKSFIIFDKYILCNKTDQKKSNNLYKLIESLFKLNKSNFELTIITEFRNEEITLEYEEINEYLKNYGCYNFNLNLIHHSKALYPKKIEKLHSRYIITNYVHVSCNDSFNFYKDNGTINNLADIQIKFSLSNSNFYSYKKDLDIIKRYVDKIVNNDNYKGNLKLTFYKNKQNILLK